jgi:hypothetical protein
MITKAFTTVGRSFGWLATIVACLGAVVAGNPAQATTRTYPGLIDGLELLSAYRNLDPRAEAAYQALIKRAPPEIQQQANTSNWASQQAQMSATALQEASLDNKQHIVRTPHGLAVISKEKLDRAIDGLTQFAIDQKDIGQLLEGVKDRLPAELRALAAAAAAALSQPEESGLASAARVLAVAALTQKIKADVTGLIEPTSQDIRDRIFSDGAAQTLESARQEARRATDQAAASQPDGPAHDQASPETRRAATVRDTTQDELDRAIESKATIAEGHSLLPVIERYAAALRETASQCRSQTAAASSAMEQVETTIIQLRRLGDEAQDAGLSMSRSMNAAKAEVSSSRRLVEAMCSPGASRAESGMEKELDAVSAELATRYAAITDGLRKGLDRLFATPVSSCASAERTLGEFLRESCAAWRQSNGVGSESALSAEDQVAFAKLRYALREARRLGVDLSVDDALLDVRLASLEAQITTDMRTVAGCVQQCSNLQARAAVTGLDQCERLESTVEKRRAEVRAGHAKLSAEFETERAALRDAIERTRSCLSGTANEAEGRALLEACRFKDSRALIEALPEGPQRSALAERWNRAYEAERQARDLVKEAVALRDQRQLGKSIGMLRQARDLTTCESTVAAIDKTIGGLLEQMAEANADKAEAALEACHLAESRKLIGALPESPRRASLMARWNKTYESETNARRLYDEARALIQDAKPVEALAKLRAVSTEDLCAATANAIATAISAAEKDALAGSKADRIAAATASCVEISGPGHRAGLETPDGRFWCVPDQKAGNRRCREIMGGVDAVAFNIKEDGTFRCRVTQKGAQALCQRAAPGWHATRLRADGSYECYPGQAVRTAQCERDNGSRGWRAGKPRRRSGGGFVWECHPPVGVPAKPPQATTPRTCPPGSFMTSAGQCLNIGAIMEGIRQPAHARPQPARPSTPRVMEPHVRPPPARARQPARPAGPRCGWKTWAGKRQCMCVFPNDPTVERGMDPSYCR